MESTRAARARSFGTVASDYDRLRPRTPAEVIDWLLPPHATRVLDLAAGTGALSDGLVARVPQVTAVEPDDRMRATLAARLPAVTALAGTAEAIPLPDASQDAVLVSSAWHWFDPARAYPEIARVLRPGGVLGVLWNLPDLSVDWYVRMWALTHGLEPDSSPRARAFDPPPGDLFDGVESREFAWARRMSADDVVASMRTYSGVIALDEEERQRRLAAARDVLARHPATAGRRELDVHYTTACWRMPRSRPDGG